jgi:predicted nuclease with TOPRIM domain
MAELPELSSKERFSHLEDKIYRVREHFAGMRSQNQILKEEVEKLTRRCQELDKRFRDLEVLMKEIQEERTQLAGRVRKVMEMLDRLDPGP